MLPIGKNSDEQKDDSVDQPTDGGAAAAAAAAPAAATSPAPASPTETSAGRFSFNELKPTRFEKSKPEDFIHIYVGLPHWLRIFLEQVISKIENVSSINYDTLLELYLRGEEDQTRPETEAEKEERLEKARKLLSESGQSRYDQHHALVLCQRYGFDTGVMILLEKLNMYYEIIQTHMEHHKYAQVIQDCHKYGKQDPNILDSGIDILCKC